MIYDLVVTINAFFPIPTTMLRSIAQSLPGPVTVDKKSSSILPRRLLSPFLGLLFLAVLALLGLFSYLHYSSPYDPYDPIHFLNGLPKPDDDGPLPTRFLGWYEREKRLPQHDPNLPYPQGRLGRYVRFSNQGTGPFLFPITSFTKLTRVYDRKRCGMG